MIEIDNRELVTLEDIAALDEHSVLDGATLYSLFRKDLVELSDDGWRLTPLGNKTFDDCFGPKRAA